MSQFTKDTAKAWNLSESKVRELHEWVTNTVESQWRWSAFVNLLRREHKDNSPKIEVEVAPTILKLTKEEIESKRHTKAQLAAWGITWPPPKGWKKRLIKGE